MKRFLRGIALITFLFLLPRNIIAQINQIVNSGTATAAANFPGTGCLYTWVNDTPGIGLAANGTGNIPSFTAINTGSTPIKATITATPVAEAFAYIANYGNGNDDVSVISTLTNMVVSTILVGTNPHGVSVSPDGSRVYTANSYADTSTVVDFGTVSVISTITKKVVATIRVRKFPYAIIVSPDGSRAYVTNQLSNDVSVVSTAGNNEVNSVTVGQHPRGIAITPDGSLVYVANYNSNSVSVINTTTNTVIATIPVGSGPEGVSVSPDGSKVYVTNTGASNSVSVINTATNTVATTIPVGAAPYGVSVSPDGSRLYVANNGSNNISVINTATNAVILNIPVGTSPRGISVSPDGSRVFVTNYDDGTVSVINTGTNTVIATVTVHSNPVSMGNFITGGIGCRGSPVTFTITVNPSPTITASTAMGNISACAGTPSASPLVRQFTVSGSNLAGDITATAPTGFEVSLAAGSGYGSSVKLPQANGTVNSSQVYVRSAASASPGYISGMVSLVSTGAIIQNIAVTGVVNVLPTVNPIPDQTVNNGAATTAINFTGTANTFTWVNDTPGIGLPASGTGNIASLTAINNGSIPVTAHITVTPISSGFAYIANGTSNSVSVINTTTNQVVATIPMGTFTFPAYVSVSPDGSRIYVTDINSNSISVIDAATNTVLSTTGGDAGSTLVVSPDGSRVYMVAGPGIYEINTATNAVLAYITVSGSPPWHVFELGWQPYVHGEL